MKVKEMKDYKEKGLFCEYEYCIEEQPLHLNGNDTLSCSVWGHNCPGGINKILTCGKKISDMPEERIYRGKIKIIEGEIFKDES